MNPGVAIYPLSDFQVLVCNSYTAYPKSQDEIFVCRLNAGRVDFPVDFVVEWGSALNGAQIVALTYISVSISIRSQAGNNFRCRPYFRVASS